jgi:hypothetical protein
VTCEETRAEAAAALLTRQAVGADVDGHLATCRACTAEVEQLEATTALLSLAVPDVLTGAQGDDAALRRLLQAAGRQSRQRRTRAWLVAASVALLLGAVGVGAGWVASSGSSGAVVTMRSADPGTGVTGTARVAATDTGSELTFRVEGVAAGTRCDLVVLDSTGARHVVSTWTASYDGPASISASSELSPAEVDGIELRDAQDGAVLLTLRP